MRRLSFKEFMANRMMVGAVKTAGDWALDVLGVPFGGPDGGKDLDGEYFTPATKLHLDQFPTPLIAYYHGYGPDRKPMGDPEYIGQTEGKPTIKADGVWWRVILDKTNEFAKRIWEAAKHGVARASSGSISQFVRIADNGEITSWPVAEISLIDEEGKRLASNPYAVALPAMKLHYQSAGVEIPVFTPEPEANGGGTGNSAPIAGKANLQSHSVRGVKSMTPEEMKQLVDMIVAALKQAGNTDPAMQAKPVEETVAKMLKAHFDNQAAATAATEAETAKIATAVKAEKDKWEKDLAASNRLVGGFPAVSHDSDTWKYDNLTPAQHGLLIETMKSRGLAIPPASMKSLMLKCVTNDLPEADRNYVRSAMKASGIEPNEAAVKTTANVMYTTGSSNLGEDWVGTAYAQQIWAQIRAEAAVVAKIPTVTIPDGYSNEFFPLDSTDPTWYKVAEASVSDDAIMGVPTPTITASYAVTAKKQITVAKMGARVLFSGEMTEDSLIPFVPQLQSQLALSGAEQLEHAVLDGDTETSSSTNINNAGGAIITGAMYTLFNGFRKIALVTGAGKSRSASGGLSEDDYLETMFLLGSNGLAAADLAKCAFIVGPHTYKASLKLASLKTKDVWANATLESGVLSKMWGYNVFPTWNMHYKSTVRKATSAGYVNTTNASLNLYGAILAVRWDMWKMAYKRKMTIETTRIANADVTEIVALCRLGLGYRDIVSASAESYNVGV